MRPQGEIEKASFERMSGGSPPGLAGGVGGFGDVGEARFCYNKMAAVMARLQEIEQNAERPAVNSEKYINE